MLKHIPTGKIYENRLQAKIDMGGESVYNKAFKNKEIIFIN